MGPIDSLTLLSSTPMRPTGGALALPAATAPGVTTKV